MAEMPPEESEAVLAFMASRRDGVLRRAIDGLAECPASSLVEETHRLSGTLGSYQLDEAFAAVRGMHDTLKSGAVPDPEALRAATLERLRQLAGGNPA